MDKPQKPTPLPTPQVIADMQTPYHGAVNTTMNHGGDTCNLMSTFSAFGDSIMGEVAHMAEMAVAGVYSVIAKLSGYIQSGLAPVERFRKTCSEKISEWYNSAIEKYNAGDSKGVLYFQDKINSATEYYNSVMTRVSDALSPISDMVKAFGEDIASVVENITKSLKELKNMAMALASTVSNSLCSAMSSAIDNIPSGQSDAIDEVRAFRDNGNKLGGSNIVGSTANSIIVAMNDLSQASNNTRSSLESREGEAEYMSNMLSASIRGISFAEIR